MSIDKVHEGISSQQRGDGRHNELSDEREGQLPPVQGFHHVAYRCRDAAETVAFYRDTLGIEFKLAIAEDRVPSTGDPHPYMHIFLDVGGGSVLAFFELPSLPEMDRDRNTPPWVQHIALKLPRNADLSALAGNLRAKGLEVLGPVEHGLFRSIYFRDPNGHRLELVVDDPDPTKMAQVERAADAMLEEWTRTKRAPKHVAWLHDGPEGEP